MVNHKLISAFWWSHVLVLYDFISKQINLPLLSTTIELENIQKTIQNVQTHVHTYMVYTPLPF